MASEKKSGVTAGVVMIALGLGLYGLTYLEDVGRPIALTALGGFCIAGYLYGRSELLLIVGGIVTGIGIGSFGGERFLVFSDFSQIGLGIGFALIYLIRLIHERSSHWWPLIPAGVLLLMGFSKWSSFYTFLFSKQGWPLILVIVGALILLGSLGRARRSKKA